MADEDGTLRVNWWLWPNVLAFDAPAVAVVWQRFLADEFGVAVPVVASVVLGLVVWGIYLTDRFFDARRTAAHQPRHRFAAKHSTLVVCLAVLSFLVAGYLCLVHLVLAPFTGGKEFLVGLLFAVGVAIPLIASDVDVRAWLAPVCGFGLACWLNCRLIERWESSPTESAHWEMCLGLPIAVCGVLSLWSVGVTLGVATGLLLLLNVVRWRTGLELARVLADVMMLTPILAWVSHLGWR